ncbi:MAG: hypothetical protein ACKVLL_13735, partial [Verrucomicrobiales bacterium]
MCTHCHGRIPRTQATHFPQRCLQIPHHTPLGKLPLETNLRRTIRPGITSTARPAFTKITDANLDGIRAFIQGLSPRWKDVENYAVAIDLPKPPAWYHQQNNRVLHAAKGKEKFVQLCASCHGPEGKGD